MSQEELDQLKKALWNVADDLRGSMNASDFQDYMLALIFIKYMSHIYTDVAIELINGDNSNPITIGQFYNDNPNDIADFEKEMVSKTGFSLHPDYLWQNLVSLAQNSNFKISHLQEAFKKIEEHAEDALSGLFSDINLQSENLGRTAEDKANLIAKIIKTIEAKVTSFQSEIDHLGDAYEYLLSQFASNSGKKAGEFYTPQSVSTILSRIVISDSQNPNLIRPKLDKILDFACGSGSLLLNIAYQYKKATNKEISLQFYGQEKNHSTYNMCRMNMLLHNIRSEAFKIYCDDTLSNNWPIFNDPNPNNKLTFDAIVANPPFSLAWTPFDNAEKDPRFFNYGLAPKSAADFAFLLHGLHYLAEDGTMAIILPHGILFRGGVEERIRTKLIKDGNIDTIIGLPSNLFYNTGIPVCIIVLKHCTVARDNILFINASANFTKGKKQNNLEEEHITKIVETYRNRSEEAKFSRKVAIHEIETNDYNLNISRYVDIKADEEELDLDEINEEITKIEKDILLSKKALDDELAKLARV